MYFSYNIQAYISKKPNWEGYAIRNEHKKGNVQENEIFQGIQWIYLIL